MQPFGRGLVLAGSCQPRMSAVAEALISRHDRRTIASRADRTLNRKIAADAFGSAAPVRDFDERSPGSALDAGWHQIVVERPLWRSRHRARTPGNVSYTLRPVVADARFLMPDRPEVFGFVGHLPVARGSASIRPNLRAGVA